jgi:tripartite-type tricarboxylate transporter receptor subunit TctC
MIAIAKARPNQMNYGSSGPGATDHLAGELFNVLAGVKMVHVPYKGGAPAMLDLAAGNVQVVFSTVSTAIAAMESKRVRPLAMTGNQRFELMPELPTVAEAGLKGFEVNNWYGIFLPTGTPKDIVTKLNAEVVKALAAPDVKKRLIEAGIVATSSSPEGFTAYVKAESTKWAKVIKDAGITVE